MYTGQVEDGQPARRARQRKQGLMTRSGCSGRMLFLYSKNQRLDGVDTVNERLIKSDFGEVHMKFFFEEHYDLDGVHGSEASANQKRSIIGERLRVAFLREQFFQVIAYFFAMVHVVSSYVQIKKMRDEAKMLGDRVRPLRVVEDLQQAVKEHHAECRHNVAADEALVRSVAAAHLRDGDGRGQHGAIKNVYVIPEKRAPQTELRDVFHTIYKMIESIAESRRGESRDGQAQFLARFEEAKKHGIEKNVDEQLFEIEIVAVPELRDRAGRQRAVGVSECVESRHAATRHQSVAPDGDRKNFLEELARQRGPAHKPGIRNTMHTAQKLRPHGGDSQVAVHELYEVFRKHREQQRPRKKLQSFQLHDGELFGVLGFDAAPITGAFRDGDNGQSPERAIGSQLATEIVAAGEAAVQQRICDEPQINPERRGEIPYRQIPSGVGREVGSKDDEQQKSCEKHNKRMAPDDGIRQFDGKPEQDRADGDHKYNERGSVNRVGVFRPRQHECEHDGRDRHKNAAAGG